MIGLRDVVKFTRKCYNLKYLNIISDTTMLGLFSNQLNYLYVLLIVYLVFDLVDLSVAVLDRYGFGIARHEKILKMAIIVICHIAHNFLMILSLGVINLELPIGIYIFIRLICYLLYLSYNLAFLLLVVTRSHITMLNMVRENLTTPNLNTKEILKLDRTIFSDKVIKIDGTLPKYESRRCVICTDEYKRGNSVIILKCDHCYHEECIRKWLEIKAICPTCRIEI